MRMASNLSLYLHHQISIMHNIWKADYVFYNIFFVFIIETWIESMPSLKSYWADTKFW